MLVHANVSQTNPHCDTTFKYLYPWYNPNSFLFPEEPPILAWLHFKYTVLIRPCHA